MSLLPDHSARPIQAVRSRGEEPPSLDGVWCPSWQGIPGYDLSPLLELWHDLKCPVAAQIRPETSQLPSTKSTTSENEPSRRELEPVLMTQ
jgi:hypothetical protein